MKSLRSSSKATSTSNQLSNGDGGFTMLRLSCAARRSSSSRSSPPGGCGLVFSKNSSNGRRRYALLSPLEVRFAVSWSSSSHPRGTCLPVVLQMFSFVAVILSLPNDKLIGARFYSSSKAKCYGKINNFNTYHILAITKPEMGFVRYSRMRSNHKSCS